MKTPVISNRRAYHDYHIFEKFECGIALSGSEVKSLREARAALGDSFARIDNGEIFLHNVHIDTFDKTGSFKEDTRRVRKLLLHKKEIGKLFNQVTQKALLLIPLRMYFNNRGIVKVELGLSKGKKLYDKRETIKRRDSELEMKRAMRRK